MLAGVVEGLTRWCGPQPCDDGQLLTEPLEPLPYGGERNPIGLVLFFEPATAEAKFDTAEAHFVDLRHRDRQRARVSERCGAHQCAQPYARCFAGDCTQRHPRIGRSRLAATAHGQVVVGSEESCEAEPFGELGDGELVSVAGALLWLDEDTEFHGHLCISLYGVDTSSLQVSVASSEGPQSGEAHHDRRPAKQPIMFAHRFKPDAIPTSAG